jgi:hypothetical protein
VPWLLSNEALQPHLRAALGRRLLLLLLVVVVLLPGVVL